MKKTIGKMLKQEEIILENEINTRATVENERRDSI